MSIWSFPERGQWGDSRWRGNSSGHVLRELLESGLRPEVHVFVDPTAGSGTFVEVAREMGLEAHGLDLASGFNALSESILGRVGKPADLCLSHPPYAGMITYSGAVWGKGAVDGDLSRMSVEEFCEAYQLLMLNQRDAVRSGGYYATLIGDWRSGGQYYSFQADLQARLPRSELQAVIIKAQHNVQSGAKSYGKMLFPRIMHEYLLVYQRKSVPAFAVVRGLVAEQHERLQGTWRNMVKATLLQLGGRAALAEIYGRLEQGADPRALERNPHWRDKVRQVLNSHPADFCSSARGEWGLA